MFLVIKFVISLHHGKNVFKQKGPSKYFFTKNDIANNVVLEKPWTACRFFSADSVYDKLTSPNQCLFWPYVVLRKAIWSIICLAKSSLPMFMIV